MWRSIAYQVGYAVRETGQMLDRVGCRLQGDFAFREQLNRHRRVTQLFDKRPQIAQDVWIAPSASVIGNVTIGAGTNVWYGSVLRGDTNTIKVGTKSTIGNRVVVHTSSPQYRTGEAGNTVIGDNVIVGDGAILHACTLEDGAVVESGAIVFDGAVVEKGAVVGPGAVVTKGKRVSAGQFWAGNPARFEREVEADERDYYKETAERLYEDAKVHEHEEFKSEEVKDEERIINQHMAPGQPSNKTGLEGIHN
eukprot:TRINITY_DN7_c0_g1_i1.p1 TRINITY_DN7_c0_g1~~TRINITY_DN7_c0_g1_i1.p1  ORF type:complete len:259 (-),score=57.03 TRINITY_DN7_c0_g1_i1:111-863(-)